MRVGIFSKHLISLRNWSEKGHQTNAFQPVPKVPANIFISSENVHILLLEFLVHDLCRQSLTTQHLCSLWQKHFRQIVGMPMGINCTPLISVVLFYCCQFYFLC